MSDGIPSPNPQFPQQIKNVTGNSNVKIQNKNLFDKDNVVYVNGKILNDNGVEISDATGGYTQMYIPVKNNTDYIISGLSELGGKRIYFFDKNKNFISRTSSSTGTSKTFTTPNSCKYIDIQYYMSGNDFNNWQLELGSTATSYVPHAEQNYPFTFAEGQILGNEEELKDNGKDDIWGEYIFTGNENWVDYQGTQTGDFYKFYSSGVRLGRTNNMEARADAFCTHFINNNFYVNNNGIGLTQNATYISIDKTIASTPEELKSWFASQYANGTPVKLQYKKKNPTVTAYTETQQVQYNNIKANASSYDDITIISSESDELVFDMNVVAVADANKVIDSQNNEIDTIKSRLDLLEG